MKIVLNPTALCDNYGNLCLNEELCIFEKEISEAKRANQKVTLTLFSPPKLGNSNFEDGTFSYYCRKSMLIWNYKSTTMQERFLGQLLTCKLPQSKKRLREFDIIDYICLHNSGKDVINQVLNDVENKGNNCSKEFLEHWNNYFAESGNSKDAKDAKDNYLYHVFLRHIMFVTPIILHAFGNRSRIIFGGDTTKYEMNICPISKALERNDIVLYN